MKVWAFDENRADFVDAAPERMNADATGYYIIRRGDDVLVREHGQERPMPERLTVAGVPFDREQFEHTHPLPLRAEMKRDGQWARAQLQARDRAERHCCKVSDEAAFCLIQRPYISKTLLTRRISPRGSP